MKSFRMNGWVGWGGIRFWVLFFFFCLPNQIDCRRSPKIDVDDFVAFVFIFIFIFIFVSLDFVDEKRKRRHKTIFDTRFRHCRSCLIVIYQFPLSVCECVCKSYTQVSVDDWNIDWLVKGVGIVFGQYWKNGKKNSYDNRIENLFS